MVHRPVLSLHNTAVGTAPNPISQSGLGPMFFENLEWSRFIERQILAAKLYESLLHFLTLHNGAYCNIFCLTILLGLWRH